MGLTLSLLCNLHLQAQQRDSVHYPIADRRGDAFSAKNNNPFSIRDTSLIKQSVEYDPKTKQYYIVEKIGNKTYRTPTAMDFNDFLRVQAKQSEQAYFQKRAEALDALNAKTKRDRKSGV